ncbi:triose-phosphate isomerase [Candidatus Gracilibacteria bacterium]|nr:triose-phosphate isomerase [Candidatus Gracilibacteria bacterium]
MIKCTVPIIVGNWKTTPETLDIAKKFIKQLDKKISSSKTKLPKKSYLLAVTDIFIPHLNSISTRGYIGSQNVSGTGIGQVTGVNIPSQLLTGGASFTIVGHSEVRKQGETVDARAHKVTLALQSKLTTILCFGEHTRDKNGNYLSELEEDVKQTLSLVDRKLFENLIIAYEPVWAIGGNTPATASECFEVVIALRRALASLVGIDYAKKVHVLYGGAVAPDNAKNFIEEGGVDGLLIGRASQDVSKFIDIINSCYIK